MDASTTALTPPELAAWRGFLTVHARVTGELDAEMRAEHGISVSSYEVLLFLAEGPDRRLRMAEIADRVLLSRSGLTRLVDRLVDLGHVTRCAVDEDRRGSFAELTESGLALFEAARRTHLAGVRARFLDRLSGADQEGLGAIWGKVLDGSG